MYLSNKLSLHKNRSDVLGTIQSPPTLCTNPKASTIHLKRLADTVKDLDLGNKGSSW